LGEPGSGKTTTLLQLARDLIAEVDSAFTQPVPVILNLSTWTNKQQPLDEWLIGELNSKYRLPKRDGKKWLRDRRIMPMLDGLDEVKAENRVACVEKINKLIVDYGLQGLVVCSRIKDYTDLNVRLAFYRAIYLQPLTPEQITEYLNSTGDELASLQSVLQVDKSLQSMVQSPLILNIMSLTYQNISAEALHDSALTTDKARRKRLFDAYVTRMFQRKTGRKYKEEQTRQWLSWLARNMQGHNQDVFLIEDLQPSWLSTTQWQLAYILSSRLFLWLSIGVSLGFVLGFTGMFWIAVKSGLIAGIIDVIRVYGLSKQMARGNLPQVLWSFGSIILAVAIVGLIFYKPFSRLNYQQAINIIQARVLVMFMISLVCGLLFGEIFGGKDNRTTRSYIQTVEALHWTWRRSIIGMLSALLSGSLLMGSLLFLQKEWAHVAPTIIIVLGLIGAIFGGLTPKIVAVKFSPNQGIHLSIRYAIIIGLFVAGLFGLILFSLWYFGVDVMIDSGSSLPYVLFFGLTGALWFGGVDAMLHYALRLILLIQGGTPTDYAHFLDYAVDRIFLQKVGGGYRFIHRMLLEHFAEMDQFSKKV
jgi:DNA polymerase III delta prime subunit